MLERTDRIALAVVDLDTAIESYRVLFDAEVVADVKDPLAGARRVTLQWGRDQLELLQPSGPGPVAAFIEQGRRGVFAGGFGLRDPAALAARLESRGVRVHARDDGRFVVLPADLDGIGVILSPHDRAAPLPIAVGLNDRIWQITYAVPGLAPAVERFTELFALGDRFTNYYDSPEFGYTGAITWFDARRGAPLDSLEYLEPVDAGKNVSRFVARQGGGGVYMASVQMEPDRIPELRLRLETTGGGWQGTHFGGFVQPRRLAGLLLGVVTFEGWDRTRPLPANASS
jgi:hypothetical protein